jgi:Trypsin
VNVKLGEHNLETEIDCEYDHCADPLQVIKAKSVFVPTEYDVENLKHDIALIELLEAVNITTYVSPVCLPWSDNLRQVRTERKFYHHNTRELI